MSSSFTAMRRQTTLFGILSAAIAAGTLSACQAPPTTSPDDATLAVVPRVQAYHTLSAISPYTAASVNHVVLALLTVANGVESPVTSNGAPVTADVPNASLGASFTFAHLKRNTTYRVRATAYRAAGTAAADVISQGTPSVDVAVGTDDQPAMAPLAIALIDRTVTAAPVGPAVRGDQGVNFDDENTDVLATAFNATDDETLVVWEDTKNLGTTGVDIHARRFDANGKPVGAEIVVASDAVDENAPVVAYNRKADEYLVVWSLSRSGGDTGADLYAQRVGATGTLLGAPFAVASPGGQLLPVVTYNADADEYMVAWQDARSSRWTTYARRVSGAGIPLATEFPVSTTGSNQYSPHIAYNPANQQYLIDWQDDRNQATNLYARLVDRSGSVIGNEIQLTSQQGYQYPGRLACNPATGEFLVCWQGSPGADADIFAQRLDGTGALQGAAIAVSTAVADQVEPQVCFNTSANEYMLCWEDFRNFAQTGVDVYAQRLAANGTLVGDNYPVSVATNGQLDPQLAYNSRDNNTLVFWADDRYNNLSTVFGQLVDSFNAN